MAKNKDRITEVSPTLWRGARPLRQFSHEFESGAAIMATKIKQQVALRETPTGRIRVTATVYETDERPFQSLTVQRWDGEKKPGNYLALNAEECVKFIEFMTRIKKTTLDRVTGFMIHDRDIDTIITSDDIDIEKLEAAARSDPAQVETLSKFVEQYSLRDLKAVAYRRGQLDHFKHLLEDQGFLAEQQDLHGGPEKVWQAFFEKNHWIFGYGLSYMPLSSLDGRKLEQYILGRSLAGVGKEADAIMKSNALISGIAVVEIKTPYSTALLNSKSWRSGVYHPSEELSAAVAQMQVTTQMAVETYGRSLHVQSKDGDRTGEELHFVQPRGFVVAGHLRELMGPNGINEHKYRSFEIYRRSLRSPEILTFDELYERARHIVDDEQLTEA